MPPSSAAAAAAQGSNRALDEVINENRSKPLTLTNGKTSTPLPSRPPSRTANAVSTPRNGAKPKELKQSKLAFPLATTATSTPASEPRPRSVASRTSAAVTAGSSRAPSSEPRPARGASQVKRKSIQQGLAASIACIPDGKIIAPITAAATEPAPQPAAQRKRMTAAEMRANLPIVDIRDDNGALVEPPSEFVSRARPLDAAGAARRARWAENAQRVEAGELTTRRVSPPERPATVATDSSIAASERHLSPPPRPVSARAATPEQETPFMHESLSNFSPPPWHDKVESMTEFREAAGLVVTAEEKRESEKRKRKREMDKARDALEEGIRRSKGNKVRDPVVNGRLVRGTPPVASTSKGKARAVTPPPPGISPQYFNGHASSSRRFAPANGMQTVAPAISPSKRKALLDAQANGGVGKPSRLRSPNVTSPSKDEAPQREHSSSPLVHGFSIVYGAKYVGDSDSSSDEEEIPLRPAQLRHPRVFAKQQEPVYTADGRRILAPETQLDSQPERVHLPAPKARRAPIIPSAYVPPPPAPVPPPYVRDANMDSSQTEPGGTFTLPSSQAVDQDVRMTDIASSQTEPGGTFTFPPLSAGTCTQRSSHTAPGGTFTQPESPPALPSPSRTSHDLAGGINLLSPPSPFRSPSPTNHFHTAPSQLKDAAVDDSSSRTQRARESVWYGETYESDNASGSSVHEFDETYREPEPEKAQATPLRSLPPRVARPSSFEGAAKKDSRMPMRRTSNLRVAESAAAAASAERLAEAKRLKSLMDKIDDDTQPLSWSEDEAMDDADADSNADAEGAGATESSSLSSPPPLEPPSEDSMPNSTPPPVAYRSGPRSQQQRRIERKSETSENRQQEREEHGRQIAAKAGHGHAVIPLDVESVTATTSSSKAQAMIHKSLPPTGRADSASERATTSAEPPRRKAKPRASLWARHHADPAWDNLKAADIEPRSPANASAGPSKPAASAQRQASLGDFGFAQQPARRKRKAPPGEDEDEDNPINRGMEFDMPEADEWDRRHEVGTSTSTKRTGAGSRSRGRSKERAQVEIASEALFDPVNAARFAAAIAARADTEDEDDDTQPLTFSDQVERQADDDGGDETQGFEQTQRFPDFIDDDDVMPPEAIEAMQVEQARQAEHERLAQLQLQQNDEDLVPPDAYAAMLREQERQRVRSGPGRRQSQGSQQHQNTQNTSTTDESEARWPNPASMSSQLELDSWFHKFRGNK